MAIRPGALGLALGLLLAACGVGGELESCDLAEEWAGCLACADGEVSCSYDGYEATEMSCGGCQARSALYGTLCDAGVEDAAADIEAETVCEDAD